MKNIDYRQMGVKERTNMNLSGTQVGDRHPRVSIVMTVYNHEEFVSEAIESVLSQSFEDYEFIIINDGSTDNTERVISTYEERDKIVIKKIDHAGRSRALNVGFKMARGYYTAIIDSDDIFLPEKIRKQVEYLDHHPEMAMVGTDAIEHDLENNTEYLNTTPRNNREIKKLLLYDSIFPFPTAMMRTKILEKVGFCNETLDVKIDFELFGKIASKGKIGVIPEVLVTVRRHPKNNFKAFDPERHRKSRLKVRWLNLWRLRPHFLLFVRMLLWHSYEYSVNLFPSRIRHRVPEHFRDLFKKSSLIDPQRNFGR